MPEILPGNQPADSGELTMAVPMPLPIGRPRTIAIVCPQAPEPWDWTSLQTGIGGSEEAVVRLSRQFALRGHSVTVYGGGRQSVWEVPGGTISFKSISDYVRADVLIGWRYPELFVNQVRPLEAEWRALWLHDSVPAERVAQALPYIDRIWCISNYHSNLYAHLGPKVYIGRNGIDPEDMPGEMLRNTKKIVYISSPFRGLDTLLEYWPEIKKRVPEAELHAYYGWESSMATLATPDGQAFKARVDELLKQDGVTWHGRVGQAELYREVRSAGVWAYPTRWNEEHCISAYVAQACGAWPVVYPMGALPQSVVWGYKVGPEDFTNSVIAAMKHSEDERKVMMDWTRAHTSWAEVASDWERLFRGLEA
jgi:glycosyltransferase involved in cell wall biosynthesis